LSAGGARAAEPRHEPGSRVDVHPVDGPTGVAEHLVEEDPLAAAVPVTEGVDQCEFWPVPGDGVGCGMAVSGAGSSGSDLGEDPVQFFGQELWPGVGAGFA